MIVHFPGAAAIRLGNLGDGHPDPAISPATPDDRALNRLSPILSEIDNKSVLSILDLHSHNAWQGRPGLDDPQG
jgi:hypothetical protein